MKKILIAALLVMGFSGLVAQVLLIRELLITFYGNELSIGLILANWLILEAMGSSLIGRLAERIKRRIEAFVGLQLILSIFLPLSIYLTRIAKNIMGLTPGEAVGLLPILYSSFFILAPISLPHGAQFTFGCKIYSILSKEEAPSIGKVYIYETVGTILGGLLFTYLFIPYFHSIQIALMVAAINFISAFLLLQGETRGNRTNKFFFKLSLILFAISLYLLISPRADEIHHSAIQRQWRDQLVLHYQNSIYGNVAVTKRGEQYTFFSDGIPVIATPVPDIAFVEEFVHLPMLFHPSPKRVLLISGGVGGVLTEILKHGVEKVDYAELDPLIIKMVQRFTTPLTIRELSDPRLEIRHIDGRLFARITPYRYDLIMVGLSSPSTLQINRLFTKEFFLMVRKILKEEGILVLTSPSSLTYISEEIRNLNACIINTLKEVYPHVRFIPGDFVLYLASPSSMISAVNPSTLNQRLKERRLETRLLTTYYIEYKLHERWLSWYLKSLQDGERVRTNKDFLPLGLFYDLSYWNALFSPYIRGAFRIVERINLWMILLPLSLFVLAFIVVRVRTSKLQRTSLPFAIATTGFAGMAFNLVLILSFQSLYGYVYHQIGLLITTFMAGLALGSLLMTRALSRISKDTPYFVKIELLIIVFSIVLPLTLLLFHSYMDRPLIFTSFPIIFLFLCALSGFLVGFEFPLANKIYLKGLPSLSAVAGTLYASDLLGAWVGALVVSVSLIPVLGIVKTCLVATAFKISSFILLLTALHPLEAKARYFS